MTVASGTRVGPYEIVSAIGSGGMGEVYRARDPRLGRDVALKFLPALFAADADRLARFAREAHLLASLNHANIAQVYGLEETGPGAGAPALVMELVEGPTIADRIAAGPIAVDEALPMARQIADAVEYAHELGIIHRDLKPANIKRRPDGTVKVLDFGLAKALNSATASEDATNTPTVPGTNTGAGVILGTPGYMAPEQARGRVVDKRTDIWAFGVVLFEMLTGRHPFAANSATDMLASIVRDDPPWHRLPATTPAPVRVLLQRCLDRDPKQRLRDIGEARVLLDAASGGETRAPADRAATTPNRSVVLWRMAALALGLIAIAAIATLLRPTAGRVPFPVRFTIPQSPAIALYQQTISPSIAVSPDGQLIATAAPEGLFLWSAATGSSRLLEDTAGANAPFFSPDGNHIGFFAGEELRRIPVSGGSASVVAPAQSGAATWGRDDTILYTRWRGEGIGLWQVRLGGGEPRLVVPAATLLDLHGFPSFLPDGRRYVFLKGAYSLPVGKRQICIGDLDGAESACVAQGDSNAVYSPSGHLIFVRAGGLVALPFDERRLQATGSVATLARGIRWFGPVGVAAFGVSADGRVLVHTHALAPHRLVWFDRTGKEIGQVGASAMYNIVRLSPDGTRIAVDIWNEANGGRDLWWIDVASGDPTRVTFDPVDVYLGAWAPDGRSLLYGRPATGPPDLSEIPITGGVPRTVLNKAGVQLPQDWSSDRRWIAYVEIQADRDERHLWLLPREGEPRRVRDTPAYTFDGRFSPDGRGLAYVSNETGRAEVYVTSLDGATQPRRVSRAGGFLPRWRGDGREMFFFQPDGMLMAADLTAGAPSPVALFRVNDVSKADVYSAPREGYAVYEVSGDGQRFLLRAPDRTIAQSDELRVWVDWAAARR